MFLMTQTLSMLICPICQQALTQSDKRWFCANAHSFDVAKEGYVNLLPVQHKKSRSPGDTPEAVQARRAFLQVGYYQPLRDLIQAWLADIQPKRVLDLGCGEGYYTSIMSEAGRKVIGLDIAKPAIQIAAKRYADIQWLVASGAKIPLQANALDLVTSFFSPLPVEEMSRILVDQGYVLMATPAPRHLYSVREALFGVVQLHEPEKFIQQLSPYFDLVREQVLTSDLTLGHEALKQLLSMTPYAWKAKAERRQQLESNLSFMTQACFCLYLFKKKSV